MCLYIEDKERYNTNIDDKFEKHICISDIMLYIISQIGQGGSTIKERDFGWHDDKN